MDALPTKRGPHAAISVSLGGHDFQRASIQKKPTARTPAPIKHTPATLSAITAVVTTTAPREAGRIAQPSGC